MWLPNPCPIEVLLGHESAADNQGNLHCIVDGANGLGWNGGACAASLRIEVEAAEAEHFSRECGRHCEFWLGRGDR